MHKLLARLALPLSESDLAKTWQRPWLAAQVLGQGLGGLPGAAQVAAVETCDGMVAQPRRQLACLLPSSPGKRRRDGSFREGSLVSGATGAESAAMFEIWALSGLDIKRSLY
jgi:hypothetical protein